LKLVGRFAALLILMGAIGAYSFMGIYEVEPDEDAVVLRLGAYNRTSASGLHW
jgi:regulator of protease activity HflC (stomatin/prohibitin superfamily)